LAQLAVVCLAAIPVLPLAADKLELANGDVITGTILEMDENRVVIETGYGVLEIDRAAVRRGEFAQSAGAVSDGLVFHFAFSATVVDETGAYRATNNGMRFVADRDGLPAAAIRSDGSGTYLSLVPTPELNALTSFTLSFQIRLEDLSFTQYLFSKWDRADGESATGKFTVQTVGGHLTVYVVDDGGTYHWVTARNALVASQWHTVAVTFTAGRTSIYVDGELAATRRFEFTDLFQDSEPILIMTAQAQTDDPFAYYNAVGTIDEVRLYSRALSAEEVASFVPGSETE
jgi:hypothetical protein